MDVEDTVETYRMRRALSLIGASLHALLQAFAAHVERYADLVCMGYTHLQSAEPTTRRLPVGRLRARPLDRRCATARRLRCADAPRVSAARSGRRLPTSGCCAAPAAARAIKKPTFSATSVLNRSRRGDANLSAQARLSRAFGARGSRRIAFQIRSGRAAAVVARIRRVVRTVRRQSKSAVPRCPSNAIRCSRERIGSLARLLPAYAERHGKTRRRTTSNERSTIAPTGARSCPKRSCAATRSYRSRAGSSPGCASTKVASRAICARTARSRAARPF